ncbi:hypothetical protein K502DRAFT_350710 [Neoconidiobolus thromboides FSU 785]|nr:hypothetical protein K502DRAFT_350710 [Neoconidiobolus thromboides FSU 785]
MQGFCNVKSYAFDNLEYPGLNKDPAALQPLPTRGNLHFTVRKFYSSRFRELRPLEFAWNPAKNHKTYNTETASNLYKV